MSKGPRVKCLDCGDIIQSMDVHDYKGCTCYRASSQKVEDCAERLNDMIGLDENQYHQARCYINEFYGTGITVDGGGDYLHMSYCAHSQYQIMDEDEE